jgi:branched-chain amino acid transport system permease protein
VRRNRYQITAFVLSGGIAGLAGGFYAHYIGVVSPTLFSFGLVITLLSMIIIGGWGTYWGPILGTVIITLITNYIQGTMPQYQSLIVAMILVVMVLTFRGGLVGLLRRLPRPGAPR